jgi:hypothetical protein
MCSDKISNISKTNGGDNNDNINNLFWGDYDTYCSFIKENIFNQTKFLKTKMKTINSYLNKN